MTGSPKPASEPRPEKAAAERPASHIAELAPDADARAAKRRTIRDRKLRARRIRIEDLAVTELVAEAVHSSLGHFASRVEDLALYGMRLIVEKGDAGLVLAGDALTDVRLTTRGQTLYSGNALIRRVSYEEGRCVLGVELPEQGIDLNGLYRLDHRAGVGERLRSAVSQHQDVSDEFKAWTADLIDFFEGAKQCLDREEASFTDADSWTRDEAIRDCIAEAAPVVCERLNRASVELSEFVSGFDDEEHSVHRRFYRRHLCKYFHRSPLLRRAYYKPLGYAGDYEMMNMLYRSHAEGDTLFGMVVNVYACQEAAAQANINRIEYFTHRIAQMVAESPHGRLRIASVGCGPAQELRTLLEAHPEIGPHLDVALIDQEERAMQYCERTLAPLATRTGARVHFIGESIRRLLAARSLQDALGIRDLIYSAGLFDYLSDRSFQALLRTLYDATASDGHLYIGNVNVETNTTKWSMEYASDWYLIHRSRHDLMELASHLVPHPGLLEVESEPLGVNLFLHISR